MSMNKKVETRFVDKPEIFETFADSINETLFDGQTLRIEFCVTRLDQPKPKENPTARRYPSCRLVLTPSAMLALFKRLSQIVGAMEKAGVIKQVANPPEIIQ